MDTNKINPLGWRPEHKIALILALIVGAVIGFITGYFAIAVRYGAEGGPRFSSYMAGLIYYSGLWWAITGAMVGGALVYIKMLSAK